MNGQQNATSSLKTRKSNSAKTRSIGGASRHEAAETKTTTSARWRGEAAGTTSLAQGRQAQSIHALEHGRRAPEHDVIFYCIINQPKHTTTDM